MEHFVSPLTGPNWVAGGVFMHEIGHALGLAHYCSSCGSGTCAVMMAAPPTDQALEYYTDDAAGLRAIYGAETHPTFAHRESWDGASWSTPPSIGPPALTARLALSSSPAARTFVVSPTSTGATLPRSMWDWSGTWSTWGTSAIAQPTHGAVGAAYDASSSVAYDAYLWNEGTTWANKWWAVSRHTGASSSNQYWYTPTSGGIVRHGVSSAFDPFSAMLVMAWRGNNGQVTISYFRTGSRQFDPTAYQVEAGGQVQLAFGSPTVACGAASITANCIVAWADAAALGSGSHSHTLRWVHFEVPLIATDLADEPVYGPLMSLGFVMHNPPVVSYKGPATSTGAYVLSWMTESAGGAQHQWTMRKDAGPTSSWGSIREHAGTTPRVFGAVGSANSSAELIFVR